MANHNNISQRRLVKLVVDVVQRPPREMSLVFTIEHAAVDGDADRLGVVLRHDDALRVALPESARGDHTRHFTGHAKLMERGMD